MENEPEKLIPPHGGYAGLKAYRMAEVVFDGTVAFTKLYIDQKSRTVDQMVQAARSGKQNIAEGSVFSGTSKKMELKLISVARASQTELLEDYKDFLRSTESEPWTKDYQKAIFIRKLCYQSNLSYSTYKSYIEDKGSANAANTLICLIHQTNYLLDRLLSQLERAFVEEGGFTEKLYRVRTEHRRKGLRE
jgi:four helix bundle suffix protein